MRSDAARKTDAGPAEELHATVDRLQNRTARLSGRTRALRQSAQRLQAATQRLRDRLASSFPPPPSDPPPAGAEPVRLHAPPAPQESSIELTGRRCRYDARPQNDVVDEPADSLYGDEE